MGGTLRDIVTAEDRDVSDDMNERMMAGEIFHAIMDDDPILDLPVVRCGNKEFVLTVSREELAKVMWRAHITRAELEGAESARWEDLNAFSQGVWLAGADAVFSKLGFREVEAVGVIHDNGVGDPTYYFYTGSVSEGNYREVDAYDIDEVALLKTESAQASKERERGR